MKPMLAGVVKEELLDFPYIVSPKLDGIRCIIKDGVALSRSLKPIPNRYIQEILGKAVYEGFDGELIIGSPTDPNAMQNTTKGVMSFIGEPPFIYFVFDSWNNPEVGHDDRFMSLLIPNMHPHIRFLPHDIVYNAESLVEYEKAILSIGFEGVILRKPEAGYKYGRATMKQGNLLKLKRFTDDEAMVIGFVEEMHNANEATTDELGNTKRSSHQENKVGKNTLGALLVRDCKSNIPFNIGSGFSADQRKEIWDNQEKYLHKYVTYKHFPIGVKDAPRFPTFKCFRDKDDIP